MRRPIIGIYKIINPEGLLYVGQSVDVTARFCGHKALYKLGRCNRFLKKSFDVFGVDAHVFEVIEQCPKSALNDRERYWQESLNTLAPNGLNQGVPPGNGLNGYTKMVKKRRSEKHWKKYNFGVFDNLTGVYYSTISDAARHNNISRETLYAAFTGRFKNKKTNLIYLRTL